MFPADHESTGEEIMAATTFHTSPSFSFTGSVNLPATSDTCSYEQDQFEYVWSGSQHLAYECPQRRLRKNNSSVTCDCSTAAGPEMCSVGRGGESAAASVCRIMSENKNATETLTRTYPWKLLSFSLGVDFPRKHCV